jgi:AraC-like DNA-binding protein
VIKIYVVRDYMKKVYDHKGLAVRIKKMICDNHLFRDIHFSRENLANELDVSTARVSTIFQEEIGASFYEFVNRQRTYYARRLLKAYSHKNDTLEDIALQSGFSNRMTMHRMYLKVYGITPGDERKRVRSKAESGK